jgi:hypothetical protein
MRTRIRALLGMTLAAAWWPQSLPAQAASGQEAGRLEVIVAPYFMAPYMNGSVTVANRSVTVSADPGDIFDKLQFGAMLVVEARKGPWGGTLDGLYMNLEQTAEQVGAAAQGKQGALDVTAFRRLLPTVDVLVGARVNVLDAGLTLPAPDVSVSDTKTWVDPLVGVRLWAPTGGGRWRVGIRADIGGFGVGSNLAYQLYPMVGFRAARLVSIHLAYRLLDMKYETGSGADAFVYDMSTFGPVLGLALHF